MVAKFYGVIHAMEEAQDMTLEQNVKLTTLYLMRFYRQAQSFKM